MKELTVNELWDNLLEQELFTEAELQLITNINGYNVETLNDAIYARYGYGIDKKRRDEESILEMIYELNKLMLMVDSRNPLPESEKREILNNLQEAEKILKFNLDEIRKETI